MENGVHDKYEYKDIRFINGVDWLESLPTPEIFVELTFWANYRQPLGVIKKILSVSE